MFPLNAFVFAISDGLSGLYGGFERISDKINSQLFVGEGCFDWPRLRSGFAQNSIHVLKIRKGEISKFEYFVNLFKKPASVYFAGGCFVMFLGMIHGLLCMWFEEYRFLKFIFGCLFFGFGVFVLWLRILFGFGGEGVEGLGVPFLNLNQFR